MRTGARGGTAGPADATPEVAGRRRSFGAITMARASSSPSSAVTSALGNEPLVSAFSVVARDGATFTFPPLDCVDEREVRRDAGCVRGPDATVALLRGEADATGGNADAIAGATSAGGPAHPVAALTASALSARCSRILSRRMVT